MALHVPSKSQLLNLKIIQRCCKQLHLLAHLQVLMIIPILLIPALLPRHAHARTDVQTRQTVEVWPANHHREEAPVVSTSNTNSQSVIFRDAFAGDIPLQHTPAQHQSPVQQHIAPQHHSGFEADTPRHHTTPAAQTQHSVTDSSNARVAGVAQYIRLMVMVVLQLYGFDMHCSMCCAAQCISTVF